MAGAAAYAVAALCLAVPGPRAHAEAPERSAEVESTPERMLDLARLNLTEKRPETAQRVLEQLVARYPEAPEAERARAELLALYLRDPRLATGAPSATRAPEQASGPPPANAWRISMLLAPTLQDELRDTVGDRVFFSAGSTELGSRARTVIAAQAQWLGKHPELDAIVEGHADDAAVGANDDELSLRRAEAMLSQLVLEGIEPARLRVVEHGADGRIAICPDSECAAQNRRAVLRVGVRTAYPVGSLGAEGAGTQRAGSGGTQR